MLVNSSEPSVAGLLHAAEVVLGGDVLGVERVLPVAVAVPEVDRGAGQRGGLLAVQVVDLEPDGQRDALGDPGGVAEARGDVAADDAGLGEHVDAVGAVARVGPGGLLGDLAVRDGDRGVAPPPAGGAPPGPPPRAPSCPWSSSAWWRRSPGWRRPPARRRRARRRGRVRRGAPSCPARPAWAGRARAPGRGRAARRRGGRGPSWVLPEKAEWVPAGSPRRHPFEPGTLCAPCAVRVTGRRVGAQA